MLWLRIPAGFLDRDRAKEWTRSRIYAGEILPLPPQFAASAVATSL